MHFIVTGGAGFIGSHLTEQLLSEGHRVTVVDNLTTGRLENLPKHPRLTFLQKDILICQPEDFTLKVDGIAHLAAISSVTESLYRPLEAHHNNLSATLAVIQLCQALTIPKLVFASSASVYGNLTQLPISEEQKTSPLSPYGLQKLVSEQYASMFAKQLGFSFVGLRIFNVFGPRQVPNSSYSGVISRFADTMQRGLPITIYGDGNQTRDFIYVKDVVKAFTQALKANITPGSSLICNLGTGKSTSLVQLINILKNNFPQWQPEINFASPRLGDIQHSQADISRISSCLNFHPQCSIESSLNLITSSLSSNGNYSTEKLPLLA
ncbi:MULTISPECIES: NAD-dependent epimerase/dehydratase family protein [Nostoc]|uniref:NAD-dependent epimerase/dehydratase family protein n=1 Tax=Nostoc paludosum FACHB-159 TaxID=2692908 RepID=A0ABR8K8R2_9NOSO|nr:MULTISPECIES: NAD-dependent epimerase/dehydratase family protein [Nostoc]MBD2680257.1 NAD-dependent epimerase/dehydratase family protein [Nostoc sp. FACHB-857]MBD2735883.1 NAD-dependent epimerase/dehydratase family protein [Nostoc paludosum FACHB-159]